MNCVSECTCRCRGNAGCLGECQEKWLAGILTEEETRTISWESASERDGKNINVSLVCQVFHINWTERSKHVVV